tara:strand:+ start:385 stop:912 length:528 start_codon:yes stop_codon:yes gene_type:complete
MNQLTLIVGICLMMLIFVNFVFIRFKTDDDMIGIDKNGYKNGNSGIENFQVLNPANINYRMSNKDLTRLTNCPDSYYRHQPSNKELINEKLYIPQGSTLPINPNYSNLVSDGPSVDGTNKTPNSMFMFTYNKVSPDCCPATYSTSNGCICTTENQRNFIGVTRGNNKTSFHNNEI